MADAVVVTDPEFRVTAWNPAAEQLYGYSAEEMLGRSTREVIVSEDEPARDHVVDDLVRTGSVRFELAARRKDGTTVDVAVTATATAVRDVSGELVGYLGVQRDITERNRVEGEHRRLSAIVEHSADMMIGMVDVDGRPLFLNEAGQRLVGLRGMDQVLQAHLLDFYAPEGRDRVRTEVVPTILAQGRGAWELELRHFETGERITVSLDAFRLDDPITGEPIAMAAVGRDVSAHRRAEAELLEYRRRIDTILEGVTDAFYFLDGEFRFAYLNAQAVQVLGDLLGRRVVAADFIANDVFEMLPGLAGGRLERTLRRATADQRSLSFDHMYPPHGPWFEVRVHPAADGLAVSFRESASARRRRRRASATATGPRRWPIWACAPCAARIPPSSWRRLPRRPPARSTPASPPWPRSTSARAASCSGPGSGGRRAASARVTWPSDRRSPMLCAGTTRWSSRTSRARPTARSRSCSPTTGCAAPHW